MSINLFYHMDWSTCSKGACPFEQSIRKSFLIKLSLEKTKKRNNAFAIRFLSSFSYRKLFLYRGHRLVVTVGGGEGVNVLTDFVCHKGTLPLQVKGCKIMNFAQRITSAVEHGWVVIVLCLLVHRSSVYTVSSKGTPSFVASFKTRKHILTKIPTE